MARDLKLFTFSRGSGLLQAVSDEFVQLVGLPAQQLIDRPVSDVVTLIEPAESDQIITWGDPKPVLTECRLHPAGEEALTFRLIVRPDQLDGLWQVSGVDVGGMLALVLQRRELRARLALVSKPSQITMWRYDYMRDHLVWESQASNLLDVPERDLPTDLATLLSWVPESAHATVTETVDRIREVGFGRCEIVSSNELRDRHLVFRGQVSDREADGTSRRAVGVIEDATAEHDLEQQRLTIAAVDPLTGLGNRRAFDLALREEMRRAQNAGGTVSVVLLFVDRFGKFAAQVGSSIADQAVVTIGRALGAAATEGRLYRFDGASFALIVDGAGFVGAEQLMHSLLERTAAAELRQALGYSFAVTAGCASWAGEVDLKSAELLRRAERALQRAQEDGGARGYSYENSIVGYEELGDAVSSGLKRGEFELCYQPVIRLDDDRIVGLHAQAHWNRGPGLTLEPGAFMGAINSSEVAREFGRWMLNEATQQLALWDRDEHMSGICMNIDITPRHADHPRLSDDIARALNQSGIDPSRVEIGVPATTIRPSGSSYDLLQDVRQLGVRVAVDDSKAGSIAFTELASVPADVVRIDQRFMNDEEPRMQRLGELMVDGAHICGLAVAATGVSNDAELQRLTRLQYDLAQGDHIAKAMTPSAVLAYTSGPSALMDDRFAAELRSEPR